VNSAVRYPDALVTCSKFEIADRVIPGVVVVFEILGPTSGGVDRIIKVREYAAVPSILRYVILESNGVGLTVFERSTPNEPWRASTLTKNDILRMPEIGVEIPVTEFYEDITFPEESETASLDVPAQQQLQGGPLAGEGGAGYQQAMGRIACGDAFTL